MRLLHLFLISTLYTYATTPIEALKSVDSYTKRPSSTPSSTFREFGENSKIRALYLNRYAAKIGSPAFKRALSIAKNTPINAFVIDIKDVQGYMTYKSSIPEVIATGANRRSTIEDMRGYISYLKSRGIYTIARIAVFKDNRQALKYPSRAIKTRSGRVWRERDGGRWIDPGSEEGRRYTLKIAQEVAKYGFDEINFDYIRFPARKGLFYKNGNSQKDRVEMIERFLSEADSTLRAYGVKISVDIFGYVMWNRDDLHIGQVLESISPYVDYICPMLYPSGYHSGTMGLKNPTANPYRIVKGSLERAGTRIPHNKFRPWLQSFRDYAFDRRAYTHSAIAAQIAATRDYGTSGWLLWNPNSRYSYIDSRLFQIVSGYKSREHNSKYRKIVAKEHKIKSVSHTKRVSQQSSHSPLDILRN